MTLLLNNIGSHFDFEPPVFFPSFLGFFNSMLIMHVVVHTDGYESEIDTNYKDGQINEILANQVPSFYRGDKICE